MRLFTLLRFISPTLHRLVAPSRLREFAWKWHGSLAAIILCALFLSPGRSLAGTEGPNASLDGRWLLVFELPDGYYQSPVEFTTRTGGEVDFTVLGNLGTFNITSGNGRLSGTKLTLNATTSWGKVKLNATVEGDRLRGTWSRSGLIASLLFKGEVHGARDRIARATAPHAELFDAIWEQVNSSFYDPRFHGADWPALRSRYRPLVESARTDGEFLGLIRRLLAELHSSHLECFATPGNRPVWTPKKTSKTKAVTWRRQSATVGYLKISSFDDDEPQSIAAIDQAFQELGDLPSLVIDLRGNTGGGSVGLAVRIGDYIFASQRPAGFYVTRAGLMERGATSIDQIVPTSLPVYSGYNTNEFDKLLEQSGGVLLTTGGRVERPYRGRVAVLIDEHCYSAAEAFASVIKEARAGTLVGRRTAGMMLGADFFSLPDGWMLVVPVMDFRTAKGVRVEGVGVEPDILVKAKRLGDPELARALRVLKKAGTKK